ncbi:5-hydroxytryptamine receptor 1B-like [Paramacrobiotus metropolitanus]|uniref:5-hydroxytryptamine receptor 1B-like n=1 Tax=Paramacrobiotus metropolitanus TaxID=2943436 RepID=UPI00244592F4|nr:5-hydroxytryptamine receptor 1B-like [Paramacrobiotus metropolitanus]
MSNHPVILNASFNNSSLHFSSSVNGTEPPHFAIWTIAAPFIALLTNSAAIILMVCNEKLRTPFNVYIMALMLSNIAYVTIAGILSLTNARYIYQNWTLGVALCTVRIYTDYAVSAVTVHLHLLVSLSRAWALFGPMSYRSHHTRRLAVMFCVGMVLYVHILLLPGIILDAVYYRLPVENGCWVNNSRQMVWSTFTTVVVFDIPKLFIPVCYPVLLWKTLQRRKIGATLRGQMNDRAPTAPSPSTASNARADNMVRRESAASRPFIVLTLFTVGIVVCWIPGLVLYLLVNFISRKDISMFYTVSAILYSLQAILDPVFFCLSVKDLRSRLCLMGGPVYALLRCRVQLTLHAITSFFYQCWP